MATERLTAPKLTKGQRTRSMIVREAAALFNTRGYGTTAVSDILTATGLEKGGLYNQFPGGKGEIARVALDFALAAARERVAAALESTGTSHARLGSMIDTFYADDDIRVKGGCPIQNVAVEADDGGAELRPLLRQAARAMADWQARIAAVVQAGIAAGELRSDASPGDVAIVLTAGLEGGLMLAKLLRDATHRRVVASSLRVYVDGLRRTP